MNERFAATTVAEIVARDFRTAMVFEQFGIDFCCGGRRRFEDACRAAAADPEDVARVLDALPPLDGSERPVAEWSIDQLVDHIVSTHHAYVRTAMPAIRGYLAKLVDAHGVRHPELRRVAACFDVLCEDLERHLIKEEQVVFP